MEPILMYRDLLNMNPFPPVQDLVSIELPSDEYREVGKSDDIKSVNNNFGSPVLAWKEVGRVNC
jgi:hypothetical protein